MTERSRSTKRSPTKKRPGAKNSAKSGGNRYLPLIIFGSAFIVIAVILGVLLFAPSAQTDPLDKSQGPTDAKVVVTEYGDYQCPACKVFAQEVAPKIKADFVDQGLIRFQFRQMAFIGEESLLAAEASECANEQGKFWEYYDKIYANQGGENVGTYTTASLTGYAQELKLDMSKFSPCLSTHKYRAKVNQETKTAEESGITSTPSVTINGKLAEWGGDYLKLKALITQAVANTN